MNWISKHTGIFPYVFWSGNVLLPRAKSPTNRFKRFRHRIKLVYVDKGTRKYINDSVLNPKKLATAYFLHYNDLQHQILQKIASGEINVDKELDRIYKNR